MAPAPNIEPVTERPLAPYAPRYSRSSDIPWDYYDDCPLDPDYVPACSLQKCTR